VHGLRALGATAALVLLVAGCTQDAVPSPPVFVIPSETPSPTASSAPVATGGVDAPGRIVALDDLGRLVTLRPDGSGATVLAEPVEGETLVRQPTWSPDGDRIAWVRLAVGTEATTAVVTAAPDGTAPSESPTTVIPFYLYWDPTSSRIAYLGSGAVNDIELGLADAAGGTEPVTLDVGAPLYFSWDPSGEQLLEHVGGDHIDTLRIDGDVVPIDDRAGTFNAPVWTSDGRSLVYASVTGDGQRLLARDVEADRADELVRYDGGITFVVSRDGSHVAFQVVHGPDDHGPLSILDRGTGEIDRVTTDPVAAYFWSPDGRRLLYLLPETTPDGVWFRWGVWARGSSFTTARFVPSDVFARDYLQFFEQYAQSMTLWAPDGSAFTYAGSNESGDAGVWIQPARAGTEPVLVTEGVFAEWSPA
jgi:TolB protein